MRCLRTSYRTCGREALLPISLQIPLSYEPSETPFYRGGFADVWKGQHLGRDVAAKGLRVYEMDDFDRIRKVGSPMLFLFIHPLSPSCTEVLQGSHNVEDASPSKRVATARRNDD
jgi:hypothetical protein